MGTIKLSVSEEIINCSIPSNGAILNWQNLHLNFSNFPTAVVIFARSRNTQPRHMCDSLRNRQMKISDPFRVIYQTIFKQTPVSPPGEQQSTAPHPSIRVEAKLNRLLRFALSVV